MCGESTYEHTSDDLMVIMSNSHSLVGHGDRHFAGGSPLIQLLMLLLACSALFFATPIMAQPPAESLTADFPGLTAKERSRIAKKESEEAKADAEYQTVMSEAERFFQDQQFEQALSEFRKARTLRPYNVYPKVKIKDLEAMLGKSVAAPAPVPLPVEQPEPSGAEANATYEPGKVISKVEEPSLAVQRVREKRSAIVEKVASAEPAVPTRQIEGSGVPVPGGVTELRYKEANAFVIERRVLEEQRPVVYKRVQNAFGQVYYFKDSTGIGARVWKERFSEP